MPYRTPPVVELKDSMVVEYKGEIYQLTLSSTLNEYGGKNLGLRKKRLNFILEPVPKDDKVDE